MCECITTFTRVYVPVNQTRRTRPCRDVENHLEFQRCSVGGVAATQTSIFHRISNWIYVNCGGGGCSGNKLFRKTMTFSFRNSVNCNLIVNTCKDRHDDRNCIFLKVFEYAKIADNSSDGRKVFVA